VLELAGEQLEDFSALSDVRLLLERVQLAFST